MCNIFWLKLYKMLLRTNNEKKVGKEVIIHEGKKMKARIQHIGLVATDDGVTNGLLRRIGDML
jgi:hypothetical protein